MRWNHAADIAALGVPDDQVLPEDAQLFELFAQNTASVPLRWSALEESTLVYVLTHKGKWLTGKVTCYGVPERTNGTLWLEAGGVGGQRRKRRQGRSQSSSTRHRSRLRSILPHRKRNGRRNRSEEVVSGRTQRPIAALGKSSKLLPETGPGRLHQISRGRSGYRRGEHRPLSSPGKYRTAAASAWAVSSAARSTAT